MTIVRDVLEGGLTLVTEEMPHVRSAAVGVWLRRGSRHEREQDCGIAHFIEHMVFKGTKTRSAEQIAAEVDSIGGNMDAFTSKEHAAFHLKVLDEHLPRAVEILGDIVLRPAFDPLEMAKEKKVIFEEMGMVEDTPDDLVMELFTQEFWPDHPLGRPILGHRATVGRFTREDLLRYFRGAYRSGNMVISAAGRLKHAEVRRLVEDRFGGLAPGGTTRHGAPPRAVRRVVRRSKRELEQVHVCVGVPAPGQTHPDRYGAYLLSTILGGSLSSRLFQEVREKRGLAYSISSGVSAYADAGVFNVYAGTGLGQVDEVLRLVREALVRLREEPVPADELRRSKDHLKGGLVLALESTGSRMSQLARQEIAFGRLIPLDEVLDGIEVVSAGDVLRLARELFQGKLHASLLGNLGRYRPRPALLRL